MEVRLVHEAPMHREKLAVDTLERVGYELLTVVLTNVTRSSLGALASL